MINQRNEQNLERTLTDLVHVGRMWTSQGLTVGKMALQSSATTLGIAADVLAQLAADFAGDVPAGGADAADVVIDAPMTSDNLASSAPGCDNQMDEADPPSSRSSS